MTFPPPFNKYVEYTFEHPFKMYYIMSMMTATEVAVFVLVIGTHILPFLCDICLRQYNTLHDSWHHYADIYVNFI